MTSRTVDTSVCRTDALAAAVPVPTELLETLATVADPMRWRILTLLADAELCTTHLQALLDAKQNLVSHHMKVLREAGLVLTEPCGRFTYYRIKPGALDSLHDAMGLIASASHAVVPKRPC